MRKPYQSPGRMKNSYYFFPRSGIELTTLPHTVASNMVKVSHALNHSATEAVKHTDVQLHLRNFLLSENMYLSIAVVSHKPIVDDPNVHRLVDIVFMMISLFGLIPYTILALR